MMKKSSVWGTVVIVCSVTLAASANEPRKRRKRTELDADITCIKEGSDIKLHVLAENLRGWLVRASDGSAIVAQDLDSLDVASGKKNRTTVKVEVHYRGGGSDSIDLVAKQVEGTDAHDQDRKIAITDCTFIAVKPEDIEVYPSESRYGEKAKPSETKK